MDFTSSVEGVVGNRVWLPIPHDVTALTLNSFVPQVSVNGALVASPATSLSLTLTEVSAGSAPGLYYASFIPDRSGTYHFFFTNAGDTFRHTVSVSEASYADPATEGDYTVTVTDGVAAVEGATVRIYNSAGTRLVNRGTTDSDGQVTFYGLPVGSYQARVSKSGYDFSSINPSTITVVSNEGEAPVIEDVVPSTVSIGDWISIRGKFLGPANTKVLFDTTEADPTAITVDGTLIIVQVPAGLTAVALPIRVVKDDPANPPSGTLLSNIFTVVRS